MRENKSSEPASIPYDLRYTSRRRRDSPSSSILKSPTPFFITSRNSSVRTRRLKFANGPDGDELLNDMREGSYDSASTSTSAGELPDVVKVNYDGNEYEEKLVEVSLSAVERMKVSPDSWNAFLEYQKYKDHSNETEKTDYTYSRLSKYRDREIIPGFRIRPNLSRRPIHLISSNQMYSSSWSPEVNYCVKKTVYECNTPSRGSLDVDTTFDRSELYKNEMTDYTRHDGYLSNDTLMRNENYEKSTRFGSDGRVLLRGQGFGFSNLSADKHSTLGTSWGFDETDDFITTAVGGESSSYSSWRKIIVLLTTIYTTIFHGVTSVLSLFKDLFSRYILRRNVYPYNYSSSETRFWPQSGTYSYGKYNTRTQGRLSNWWYQSFFYALYSKIMSSITRPGQYLRTKYYQSSRRGRLMWFLIPFLLLLAFWLFRAEGEDAYVSNKITAFKCKANQYLSPARNQMKSFWKEISDYSESVFGQSLEPFRYFIRALLSVVSVLIHSTLSLISNIIASLLSIAGLLKDTFIHFCTIFTNIISDAVEKKDVISNALYDFFTGIISAALRSTSVILFTLGNVLLDTFQYLKYFILFYIMPHESEDIASVQPMISDLKENRIVEVSADWESLKKRIEDLEIELKKVKEEKSAGTIQYQKQLEDNHKSIQKYRMIVNEALRRQSIKPVYLTKAFMHYYLGNATDELKKWILGHFVLKSDSKDIDESKFAMLMAKYSNKSGEELKTLQNEFARFVRQYSAELSSIKTDLDHAHSYQELSGNDVSLSLIKRIVSDEIKLHDADKTGKVDYALQSAGGQVLGVKCTKNFHHCFKYSSIFGLHVCAQKRKNAPEEAINPGMAPGQCWAFAGSQGFLTLELSHSIIVTGFTMEHISRMLSPNGRIESAPRMFSMWGLKTEFDLEPYLFGDYEYKDNNETYQYFPVLNYSPHPYKIVELSIASNHGNPNYTCLYRIRVHGDMYPSHL